MEVVTIEHEAFQEMKKMFFGICDKYNQLAKEHAKIRIRLLSVNEVAGMLNISPDTVLRRKSEIGYVSTGGVIRFERENVDNWIRKHSIKPKIK